MKQLFINKKGQIILKEIENPNLRTMGSIVEIKYALISSGTELSIIQARKIDNLPLLKRFLKSKKFRKKVWETLKKNSLKKGFQLFKSQAFGTTEKNYKTLSSNLTPIGYSCSGIIKNTNTTNLIENDRVACGGSNHAQLIFSPKNLTCKIPENVSFEEAAFATLGAIALNGIYRAKIKPGEFIGILGTGLIGLITIQLAKVKGAKVVAFDLIDTRLKLAKNLGADLTLNPKNQNIQNKVMEFSKGYGLDSIIICASSKSSEPLNNAIDLIRDKGNIVLLGAVPINLERNKLYYKEADLLISRSYGAGRYDPYYEFEGYDYPKEIVPETEQRNMQTFLELISHKKVNVKPLITEIIPIEEANSAYMRLLEDPINNITFLLNFSEKESLLLEEKAKEEIKLEKKLLNIGLIGCGSFAQAFHLPHLLTNTNCKIKAISTKHKDTGESCKTKYGADYVTTDYKQILEDQDIDTVFIYTRHNSHAKFSIEALKAGKNVYVEKPMALTLQDCIEVYNTVKKSGKTYLIGFNRRYSPFIQKAKDLIKGRTNPLIITYTIANQFISGAHWIFDPNIGGGPLIGELCHFTDLVSFLIDSKPIEVFAQGGALSHKKSVYDSCVAIIRFENKSIATLTYTDLNGPDMPKERLEIYSGDSSIIINDFITMNTSGFNFGNWKLSQQDKGHKNEIDHVIKVNLKNVKPIIDEKNALNAMNLCFKIIESIEQNSKINLYQSNIFSLNE